MYAKLFSRITESSLMEEVIPVRYTFVMMLAISDPKGVVVGTDIAIARRLNMPVAEFQRCLEVLMRPDPNSNSHEEEGRRVVLSTGERGYRIVNYLVYRSHRTEDDRKSYMRDYMQRYRDSKVCKHDVNSVNTCKPGKYMQKEKQMQKQMQKQKHNTEAESVNNVNFCKPGKYMQKEKEKEKEKADSEENTNTGEQHELFEDTGHIPDGSLEKYKETDPIKLRLFSLFSRRPSRKLDDKERIALKKANIQEEDLAIVEEYYDDPHHEWDGKDFRKRALITLLNNWGAEVDRATSWKAYPPPPPQTKPTFAKLI